MHPHAPKQKARSVLFPKPRVGFAINTKHSGSAWKRNTSNPRTGSSSYDAAASNVKKNNKKTHSTHQRSQQCSHAALCFGRGKKFTKPPSDRANAILPVLFPHSVQLVPQALEQNQRLVQRFFRPLLLVYLKGVPRKKNQAGAGRVDQPFTFSCA